MTAFGLAALVPAALIAHALAVAAALVSSRHAAWCRRIAFGGSALASALMAWSLGSDARYAFAKPAPVFIGDLATVDAAPHAGGFVRAGADLEAPAATLGFARASTLTL